MKKKKLSPSGKRKKLKKEYIPRHYKPKHLSLEGWQAGLRRQYAQVQKYKIKNMMNSNFLFPIFVYYTIFQAKNQYIIYFSG